MKLPTFKDLVFKTHPNHPFVNTHARVDFPNGYGLSIITGDHAYCGPGTYGVAIIYNKEICYKTKLTDYVLSHQTPDDINKLIEVVSKLRKSPKCSHKRQ